MTYLLDMGKNKYLTVRITEQQLDMIISKTIDEEISKSNLIRNLIENSNKIYRKDLDEVLSNTNTINLHNNIKNRKNGKS